jgi:hypothetical protein
VGFLIPLAVLVGVFTIVGLGITRSTRLREARMRERVVMIEKGLVPPPELDPEGFERDLAESQMVARRRFMGAGIILVSIGLAVGVIIGIAADEPRVAVGIGGGIAILGAGLIANAVLNTAS